MPTASELRETWRSSRDVPNDFAQLLRSKITRDEIGVY